MTTTRVSVAYGRRERPSLSFSASMPDSLGLLERLVLLARLVRDLRLMLEATEDFLLTDDMLTLPADFTC